VTVDKGPAPDEEPGVYAVEIVDGAYRFPRREFLGLAAGIATTTFGVAACSDGSAGGRTTTPPPPAEGRLPAGAIGMEFTSAQGVTFNQPCHLPLPEGAACTCNCVTVPDDPSAPLPSPTPGGVPAGSKGSELLIAAQVYHQDCGSPIPSNATCQCNCVEVPLPPEGDVPEGEEGRRVTIENRTYHVPCGSPLPAGAVCTCDCVSVPVPSAPAGCSCVSVDHYWRPN
jgi:hypothetical protein